MTLRLNLNDLAGQSFRPLIALLREGGVALIPTDTVYGLHVLADDEEAIRRVFTFKKRDARKSLIVLCSSTAQCASIGVSAPPDLLSALDRLWPAPLTAILPLRKPIPASAGSTTLAVRIPATDWLRGVVEHAGPLASTSANISGESPIISPDDLPPQLTDRVDLVVDGGTLAGQPSTIVDFTGSSPKVLREGAFAFTQNLWKTVWKTL